MRWPAYQGKIRDRRCAPAAGIRNGDAIVQMKRPLLYHKARGRFFFFGSNSGIPSMAVVIYIIVIYINLKHFEGCQ